MDGQHLTEAREGDYLRQKIVLDDYDDDEDSSPTTGCFRFPKSRSTSHIAKSSRLSESHDSPSTPTSPTSRIGKLAEKSVHFFRNSHSDSAVSSAKRKPATCSSSGTSCSEHHKQQKQQPPRRRYMRVVRDENAPPPDSCCDNPNTISRYSQPYLADYYAKKRDVEKTAAGCDKPVAALPYTTSGHTILKKSLTDPSSERAALAGGSSAPAVVGSAEKHATFCDVVTVFDSVEHTVTTEHIRDQQGDADVTAAATGERAIEEDTENIQSSGKIGDFFIETSGLTSGADARCSTDSPTNIAAEPMATEDLVDGCGGGVTVVVGAVFAPTKTPPVGALQNIFSPFSEPPLPSLALDTNLKRQTALPQIKRVNLESLMEQARVSGDAAHSDCAAGDSR